MDASAINENKWISIVKYGCQINENKWISIVKYNASAINENCIYCYGCQCNKWK